MKGQQSQSIIVKASPAECYRVWSDFEQFPNFMRDITSVTKTGDRTSHWVMEGPLGKNLEWDAETTRMEENKRIAWNSIRGDIETSGQVTFNELPNNETEVTFTQHYEAGGVGETIARLFENPNEKLQHILRDFKAYVEERAQRRVA